MAERAWVATKKGLLSFQRTRRGWAFDRLSFAGEPVTSVLPPADGARPMLAALNLGHFGVKCHASMDGGLSWREVAVPVYPEQPEQSVDEVAWKLVQIWSLAAAGDTIYCGTLPGGLFRSDDFGASWQLERALWDRPERREWFGGGYDVPGIHSILIDPAEPQQLLVGISCGGAWRTRDGGQSWALAAQGMRAAYLPPELADNPNIQDPHSIAVCAAARDTLWCQHHNGIFRSVDGAATWQAVAPVPVSDFGFAVAAHPCNPDCAWFVPAIKDECRIPPEQAMAVLRTRDGGQSFDVLRDGLPQQDCFDLVYRHGLAVADNGEQLLMGSTTGSLWASENGGEHWQRIGSHFPPVLAVAFEAD